MSQEIERKFLLRERPPGLEQCPGAPIEQGYLALEPDGCQVRLRKKGEAHFLTAKRARAGYAREEYEIALTPGQFAALWPMTAGRRLHKKRYEIRDGGRVIEIDVYGGANHGLTVAEVEFPSEEEARAFTPPGWLGEEVSGRPEYSNRNLARE